MDASVIALLRCPATGQSLRLPTPEERQFHSIPFEEPALITEDGAKVYRAPNGLPVLLPPATVEVVSAG